VRCCELAEAITALTCVPEVLGSNEAGTPATLTESFLDFPHLLQTRVGMILKLGHSRFVPPRLQFRLYYQPIIRHYVVDVTDSVVK
jgi:hypothetical protein